MGDQRHIVMCLSVLGVVVGIPWVEQGLVRVVGCSNFLTDIQHALLVLLETPSQHQRLNDLEMHRGVCVRHASKLKKINRCL